MRILSLFDGMACGHIAMQLAGVEIDRYVAYEIDKYAVTTAQHNFKDIEEKGDVLSADFTEYADFDFLVGGSPCTYWSIAQSPDKRETTASGIGWELFSQYVRALRESKPRYFIYENNKSMAKEIKESITETFGFEPIMINSALVSAQNRQRLYWVGRRNADGTYEKVNVEQPTDRGILLKDILDSAFPISTTTLGKSGTLCARYYKAGENPFNEYSSEKASPRAAEPIRVRSIPTESGELRNGQAQRVYSEEGKSITIKACGGGQGGKTGLYAIDETQTMRVSEATTKGYTEIETGNCVDLSMPNSKARREKNMEDKSNCLQTSNDFYQYCGIIEDANGKKHNVYTVENGLITVKGKQYPIKLKDGKYIIRKLTVEECKRLQTVPKWYDFSCVSNSQAYKMLGNGWTCDVIKHLIESCLKGEIK